MQVSPDNYSKEYFLSKCGGYEEWQKSKGFELEPRLKKSLELARIKEGMKVLDFGCGRGEITIQSAIHKADVIGIDYSKDAIELAKSSVNMLPSDVKKRIALRLSNSKILPFEDNTFDIIFFLDVMEHLYPEELYFLLKEFNRVLKPNGRIIIHTAPNKNFQKYGAKYYYLSRRLISPLFKVIYKKEMDIKKLIETEEDRLVHVNTQTKKTVYKYLKKSGFASKIWLSDMHEISSFKAFLMNLLFKPSLIPFFKEIFAYNIWAIAKKQGGIER